MFTVDSVLHSAAPTHPVQFRTSEQLSLGQHSIQLNQLVAYQTGVENVIHIGKISAIHQDSLTLLPFIPHYKNTLKGSQVTYSASEDADSISITLNSILHSDIKLTKKGTINLRGLSSALKEIFLAQIDCQDL